MLQWNKIGSVRALPAPALLLLLACGTILQPAGANLAPPAPEEGILFHVQPVNDAFCDQPSLTECWQIQQYTADRGTLEFDLFVYSKRQVAGLTMADLHVPLGWPESWHLIDWDPCGDGQGDLVQLGNKAELTLHWDDRPELRGRLFLAARFIVEAPDYGWFGMAGFPSGPVLRLGSALGDVDVWWALPGWGEAGVECGYCAQSCDLMLPCRPEFSATALHIGVVSGGTGSARLGVSTGRRCALSFDASEGWITLAVGTPQVSDEGQSYELVVNIDATDLTEGNYEAWIQGSDDCAQCVHVLLAVLPPPPVEATVESWGQVKSRFR